MRVGMGYDVHKLVENRKLILGGVEIPYEYGLLDIPMQMCWSMPLWMRFSALQHCGTSDAIFRTMIRRMRAQTASNC